MQLHCLGTAGYHPSETRHTSCYFLPESGLLLDAGTGIFRLPSLLQTDHLDILLSHAHLDHAVGLTFLLDILQQRPVKRVRVWGETKKIEAIRKLLMSEYIFPVELPVQWKRIDESGFPEHLVTLEIADTQVTWRAQDHPGGSVTYRIDWPQSEDTPARSLVYATDTLGATAREMQQWMSGADVLLHECNFKDDQIQWATHTGHCYLGKVAEVAAATKPKRVLLTHVNPIDEVILDPNDQRFAMPCEIVSDHQTIVF